MNRKIRKGSIFATICCAVATEFVFGNDYIDWGPCGPDFPNALQEWKKGDKLTADVVRLLSNTFLCTSEKTLLKVYPDLDPGVYLVVVENGDCMIGSRKVVCR